MNDNEPIVLGKVKKGKTGKPLVVLILFLFVGSLVLFLPKITGYFDDNNILDLIKNGELISYIKNHGIDDDGNNTTTTSPVSKEILINNTAVITYSNFTINNFDLTNEDITFDINTSNNINFDDSNYYLVLRKNNKDLYNIKLVGNISESESYTFKFKEELNSTVDVKGIIKEIKESEYPTYKLSTDESGMGNITCTSEDRELEYVFQNDKLISIKDKYTYIDDNTYKYFEIFEKYNKLSNDLITLGATSSVVENVTGFIFNANIKLSDYDYENNVDSDYYSLNTKSNVINFEMNSKGYDCK